MLGVMSLLLFLTFFTLKLVGVLTWSWVWVTAPLWIAAILFAIVFFGTIALAALAVLGEGRK